MLALAANRDMAEAGFSWDLMKFCFLCPLQNPVTPPYQQDLFLGTTCPLSALCWYHELWWTWGVFSALAVPETVTVRKVTLFLYFDSPLQCRTWYKFSTRAGLKVLFACSHISHPCKPQSSSGLVCGSFLMAWDIFIIGPGKRGTSSTFLRTGGKISCSHFACRSCYHSSASERFSYCSGKGRGERSGWKTSCNVTFWSFRLGSHWEISLDDIPTAALLRFCFKVFFHYWIHLMVHSTSSTLDYRYRPGRC